MSIPVDSQPLTKHLFTLRVIVASLFAGIAVGLIAVVQVVQPPVNPVNLFLFDPVMMGFMLLGVLLVRRFLPPAMDRATRRQILQAESQSAEPWDALMRQRVTLLLNGHLTRTVVTAAIVEAPAMLGIVGYTLGATKVGPAAVLVGAGLIVTLFPTRSGFEDWLQSQFRLLDEQTVKSQQSLAKVRRLDPDSTLLLALLQTLQNQPAGSTAKEAFLRGFIPDVAATVRLSSA